MGVSRFLFIFDFFFFYVISLLTTSSIVLSIIFSILFGIFLFAFRTHESLVAKTEHFLRISFSSIFTFSVILIFSLPFNIHLPKTFFIVSFLISITLLPIIHFGIYKYIFNKTPVKKYLVIGNKDEFNDILKEIEIKSKGKIKFVDFINPNPSLLKEKIKFSDSVLVCDPKLEEHVKDDLDVLSNTYQIEYLPNLVEKVLKRIPIKVIEKFEEYYKISFRNVSESPAKRLLDIFGAIVGLIIFSPFMLITAIAILIEDGRPIVFKQNRVGKNENLFEFIKLRSLKNTKIDKNSPNKDIEKRALKIGKIIRKTRIDESLQFWLILKGKMSLVGPRPEMVEYHEMMKGNIPFYLYRLLLKPGLTGWAQLNYKHSSTLEEYKIKTEYDLYYIKNRNIFLDLQIILQTLEAIFWKRGAR